MTELTEETGRICNRHMARLLTDLEEKGVPYRTRKIVKSEIGWLRKDLTDMAAEHERG